MKKGNWFDIAYVAVKNSGATNMAGKSNVMYYAFKMGFFEFYNWIEEMKIDEYVCYMQSIDFDKTPKINRDDLEYLLDLNDSDEARNFVKELFKKEYDDLKSSNFKFTLKELPFKLESLSELLKENKENLIELIQNRVDDHAYNYLLPIGGSQVIILVDGCIYKYRKGELELLTAKEWLDLRNLEKRLAPESVDKYHVIEEQMRLAVLLEQ